MIHSAMCAFRRPLAVATLGAGGTLAGQAHPAMAHVWVGFGFPLVVGPPAYSPPVRYRPSGQSCVVSATVCPTEHPVASRSGCHCTTTQGRLWGSAA
jgi:hypothetical protein